MRGYVYVIGSSIGLYKIGCSTDPAKRFIQLNCEPYRMWIDHLIISSRADTLEAAFHSAFSNVRAYGEWFSLSASDRDSIRQIRSCSRAADAPEWLREYWRRQVGKRFRPQPSPEVVAKIRATILAKKNQ